MGSGNSQLNYKIIMSFLTHSFKDPISKTHTLCVSMCVFNLSCPETKEQTIMFILPRYIHIKDILFSNLVAFYRTKVRNIER